MPGDFYSVPGSLSEPGTQLLGDNMKNIAGPILLLFPAGLLLSTQCNAADWALPAKYDMSFPYLKAYRYGPMLGGIGTGGFSFGTMGLSNFRV